MKHCWMYSRRVVRALTELLWRAPLSPQAVSERLSRHVLKNWKRFVEGINEVATIEHDLEASIWRLSLYSCSNANAPRKASPAPL